MNAWLQAMRLHTLPVSIAGVLAGAGCAAFHHGFSAWPFIICLFFAIGAQIVSNFANEYFDFKNGLDRKGREGFRRGVTEGDISPKAMRNATFGLLAATCALGASLIVWGGWWLVFVGIAVALFALAYSTGPYPLSHHGLGELAVILFFGFVPVVFTCYVQLQGWEGLSTSLYIGGAVGLMGANVLIVNNYRDIYDDRNAGKRTLAVRFGRPAMASLYLFNGFAALLLIEIVTGLQLPWLWQLGPLVYINLHVLVWQQLKVNDGSELNKLLGRTAMLMFLLSVWILVSLTLYPAHSLN